jgi:hypothetical protein
VTTCTESGRRGIRGGNVRSVQEARDLQTTFKAELSARIRDAIVAALDRGQYHADDLVTLKISAEHLNCVGSQVALLVRQGVMKKVSMRRNGAAASNARWSGVYKYESGGREKLAGLGAGSGGALEPSSSQGLSASSRATSTAGVGASVSTPQGPSGVNSASVPCRAGADPGGAPSRSGSSEGTARLFDLPPERALHPLTDAEAA